jgi:transcriptional regulator with XRE-family HTH domain
MRDLGLRVRRVREFVGLSQEQLARAAGLSQGAVSRFESGKQLGTPLLVAVKVQSALVVALRSVNPDILSDELRAMAEAEPIFFPVNVTACPASHPVLTSDPGLHELIAAYRVVPERQREAFHAAIRLLTTAFTHPVAKAK